MWQLVQVKRMVNELLDACSSVVCSRHNLGGHLLRVPCTFIMGLAQQPAAVLRSLTNRRVLDLGTSDKRDISWQAE
jgi:hypothetical protein